MLTSRMRVYGQPASSEGDFCVSVQKFKYQATENPPLSLQLLTLSRVFCVGAATPYYVPRHVFVCVSV